MKVTYITLLFVLPLIKSRRSEQVTDRSVQQKVEWTALRQFQAEMDCWWPIMKTVVNTLSAVQKTVVHWGCHLWKYAVFDIRIYQDRSPKYFVRKKSCENFLFHILADLTDTCPHLFRYSSLLLWFINSRIQYESCFEFTCHVSLPFQFLRCQNMKTAKWKLEVTVQFVKLCWKNLFSLLQIEVILSQSSFHGTGRFFH